MRRIGLTVTLPHADPLFQAKRGVLQQHGLATQQTFQLKAGEVSPLGRRPGFPAWNPSHACRALLERVLGGGGGKQPSQSIACRAAMTVELPKRTL